MIGLALSLAVMVLALRIFHSLSGVKPVSSIVFPKDEPQNQLLSLV